MSNLVRAELRKLATVRTTLGLFAVFFVLTVAWAVSVLATGGRVGSAPLGSAEGLNRAVGVPGLDVLTFLLGVLLVTGEYRHKTVTAAFLVTPRRGRVVMAKLAAIGITGAGVAIASTMVGLAVALPWLVVRGIEIEPVNATLAIGLGGHIAHLALYGLLGVGVGALVRNQLGAALAGLLWLFAVEPLFIGGAAPGVVRWMPSGAAMAVARGELHGATTLPQWSGVLLLLAYAAVLAAFAIRLNARNDVA